MSGVEWKCSRNSGTYRIVRVHAREQRTFTKQPATARIAILQGTHSTRWLPAPLIRSKIIKNLLAGYPDALTFLCGENSMLLK